METTTEHPPLKTIDELCGAPEGAFTAFIAKQQASEIHELDALVERRRARAAELAAEAERAAAANIPNPVTIESRRETIVCGKCEQPFDSVVFIATGLRPIRKLYCDPCVFAHEAEASPATARKGAADAWAALCEPEFRTVNEGGATVVARLQRDCREYSAIVGWQYGAKGLMIQGETGACKTRAVWRLLREQFDAGKSIVALSSGRFAREYADAAGNHTQSAWFDRLASVDIFFLDDLGKKPWTENAWGEFFELVDERAKNHRPFIITTNEDRSTMQAKCKDPVTWEPLNRRLTESCKLIAL